MSNVVKISDIALQAASSEIDANAWLEVSVDVAGTPTTKYLTGEVLKEVIRDEFGGSFLVQGTGITITHNDGANTLTIAANIGTDIQAYSANLDALAADPLTASTAASTYLTIASAASTYQPLDADLTAIAALNPSANNLIYKNGSDAWDATTITTFARSLIDDANASTARSTLGLGDVENTALSTWTGSTSITTLGTIATGVWNGTVIDSAYIDQSLSVATLTASTSVTVASDLTLASGSITSASGAISFSNENLSTTGLITAANVDVSSGGLIRFYMTGGGDIELASGSTTVAFRRNSGSTIFTIPDTGAVDFGTTGVTMTGTLASGNATVTGTLGVSSSSAYAFNVGGGATFDNSRAIVNVGSIPASTTVNALELQGGIGAGGVTALGLAFNHSSNRMARIVSGYGTTTATRGTLIFETGYGALTEAFRLTGEQNATFAGKITGAASTTARATMNLPAGTAPTSPAESDMWFVGDVMYRQIGGVTKSITFT